MTRLCIEYHCLPRAGGLLDQDAKDVWLMEVVYSADLERAKKDAQFNK